MADLKPCPFCGGKASVSTYQTESLFSHDIVTYTNVGCDDCDFNLSSEPGFEVEAPDLWNRRIVTERKSLEWSWEREASDESVSLCGRYGDYTVQIYWSRLFGKWAVGINDFSSVYLQTEQGAINYAVEETERLLKARLSEAHITLDIYTG